MGFPRREYWNGFPFPTPEYLLDPGMEPVFPAWKAYSLPLSYHELPNFVPEQDIILLLWSGVKSVH